MHSYRRTFLKTNIYYKYFSSLYILTTLLMLNVVLTRIHKQTPTHDWEAEGGQTTRQRSQGQARRRHGLCLPHSQVQGLNTRTQPPDHLCIILPDMYTQPQTCLQLLWETYMLKENESAHLHHQQLPRLPKLPSQNHGPGWVQLF